MLKDFRAFILRGNVVDLAVAVIVGAAFVAIVDSLVKDIITPLLASFGGKANFSGLYFTINNSRFMYGDLINAIVSFLVIATVVFFLIVMPLNKLISRVNRNKKTGDPDTKKCPECISSIPVEAKRCAFCTSKVA